MITSVYRGHASKTVILEEVSATSTDADILETALLVAGESPFSHFGTTTTRRPESATATVLIWTD